MLLRAKLKTQTSLVLLAVAISMTGCQEKKQLKEMHDNTKEMNETTKQMNQTTSEMKDITFDMKNTTQEMQETTEQLLVKTEKVESKIVETVQIAQETYFDLRHGFSSTARSENLHDMEKSSQTTSKATFAAKFLMAFEYQLWSGLSKDNAEQRDEKAAASVREFFGILQEYTKDTAMRIETLPSALDLETLWSNTSSDDLKNITAISIALHSIESKQQTVLKKYPELQKYTMYSMIQDSLKLKQSVESGEKSLEEIPAYSREVLKNANLAIYLLQMRQNAFITAFVSQTSKLRDGLWSYLTMTFTGWELDLAKLDQAVLKDKVETYLTQAHETRQFLKSLGVQAELSAKNFDLLKNMEINKKQKNAPEISQERLETQQKIIALAESIQKSL